MWFRAAGVACVDCACACACGGGGPAGRTLTCHTHGSVHTARRSSTCQNAHAKGTQPTRSPTQAPGPSTQAKDSNPRSLWCTVNLRCWGQKLSSQLIVFLGVRKVSTYEGRCARLSIMEVSVACGIHPCCPMARQGYTHTHTHTHMGAYRIEMRVGTEWAIKTLYTQNRTNRARQRVATPELAHVTTRNRCTLYHMRERKHQAQPTSIRECVPHTNYGCAAVGDMQHPPYSCVRLPSYEIDCTCLAFLQHVARTRLAI